jgi:hypothetical protein
MRGGYVHTPADPHATAICIEGGAIVWTGDDDAAEHFLDGATAVIELDGRLVTPAFVDSHAHLGATGIGLTSLDLGTATSRADALQRLESFAARSDLPVVMAFGWDESAWPERDPLTGPAVDSAVGGRPAYVARVDVHSAIVSSALAARVPGVVSADGYAEGRVERDAHHLVRATLFTLISGGDRSEALLRALRQAASLGIGQVHELGAPHLSPIEDFAALRALGDQFVLPEVVGYWGELGGVENARAAGCVGIAGDLCMDGALGSRTAALLDPYADAMTSGHLYLSADQVAEHVIQATEADLQAGFHVIGDAATAAVVEGFEAAAAKLGDNALVRARHRLEHLEMVTVDQLAALGRLGVTASVQPMFDALWGGSEGMYATRLGAGRAAGMNPYASMNRAGMALAFGSDTPVTPFGPWAAVRAAAFHHNHGERLTVRAAFNAHTRGGWRAAGLDEGGVIALGAPASLAIWEIAGDLHVQTPDTRVAAWSTDPRAGVPMLPDLQPGAPLPVCTATLVHGRASHDLKEEFV